MSPTPRAAAVLAVIALLALVLPLTVVAIAALALAAATVVDALSVRTEPALQRELPRVLSRGVAADFAVSVEHTRGGRTRLRQPVPAALTLQSVDREKAIGGTVVARVRGRHRLGPVGTRIDGRLGLGAWSHRVGGECDLNVYPDMVLARRLAFAAARGVFSDSRRRSRGPFGTGTDFDSVRDWLPDDDVRHVNWRATERCGRPMTNQYRVDQSRELHLLVDAGRLMAAPLGDRNRLDTALDAVAAVALAADGLGDYPGAIAFDAVVRARLAPRRSGARAIVEATYALEAQPVDSDYDRAFALVGGEKRALVIVFTDLFDDAAAGALISAVPVLSRRHEVVVATAGDPDLIGMVTTPPHARADVYRAAAALDVLDARRRATARLRRAGAQVVETTPERLPEACVRAYIRTKARGRL